MHAWCQEDSTQPRIRRLEIEFQSFFFAIRVKNIKAAVHDGIQEKNDQSVYAIACNMTSRTWAHTVSKCSFIRSWMNFLSEVSVTRFYISLIYDMSVLNCRVNIDL